MENKIKSFDRYDELKGYFEENPEKAILLVEKEHRYIHTIEYLEEESDLYFRPRGTNEYGKQESKRALNNFLKRDDWFKVIYKEDEKDERVNLVESIVNEDMYIEDWSDNLKNIRKEEVD